jgi:hypothetical protein
MNAHDCAQVLYVCFDVVGAELTSSHPTRIDVNVHGPPVNRDFTFCLAHLHLACPAARARALCLETQQYLPAILPDDAPHFHRTGTPQ